MQKQLKPLRLITILLALYLPWVNEDKRIAAAVQCMYRRVPQWLINNWVSSKNVFRALAAAYALGENVSPALLTQLIRLEDYDDSETYSPSKIRRWVYHLITIFEIQLSLCRMEDVANYASSVDHDVFIELAKTQHFHWYDLEREGWMESRIWWFMEAAFYMSYPGEIPTGAIYHELDAGYELRAAVIYAARQKHLSAKTLVHWYKNVENVWARRSVLKVMAGRSDLKNFLISLAEKCTQPDDAEDVARTFIGIELSPRDKDRMAKFVLESELTATNKYAVMAVKMALLYALPTNMDGALAKLLLRSENSEGEDHSFWMYKALEYARHYAVPSGENLLAWRTVVPPTRQVEPNGQYVYKRCLDGVTVLAELPQSATIRGHALGKCRASAAIIRGIRGRFFGEKVGISIYDPTVSYRVGDVVRISDFDTSSEECSTGFHFFCSMEVLHQHY